MWNEVFISKMFVTNFWMTLKIFTIKFPIKLSTCIYTEVLTT